MSSLDIPQDAGFGMLIRRHALLAALVFLYATLSLWLSFHYGVTVGDEKAGTLTRNFLRMVPQFAFFVLFLRLVQLTYIEKVPDRFGVLRSEVQAFFKDGERMKGAAIAFIIMVVTLISFAQMKNLIPSIQPFSWDVAFMELDRALHFGRLPHEYAWALFGGRYSVILFTGLYNFWLFAMYFGLIIACFMRPDSRVRMQYLVAFLFTWAFGGNLFATLFSSAGPVYYGLLGYGDVYDSLLADLHAHAQTGALTVVDTQALLWYFHSLPDRVSAISAFPSMHVASSTLMAIFAFRISRLAGILMTTFAVLIQIGSVLLAWHYAVDGYAGAIIAILSWKAAGVLVRRFGGFADPES